MASLLCCCVVKSFILLVTRCNALKGNLALSGGNKEALISMNWSENRRGSSCIHSQTFIFKLEALKLHGHL